MSTQEQIGDGGPAYPVSTRPCPDGYAGYGHQDGASTYQFSGMTLRDYFAAKVMQAMVSLPEYDNSMSQIASYSYDLAEEMIKEHSRRYERTQA